jgi:hypothetical protein
MYPGDTDDPVAALFSVTDAPLPPDPPARPAPPLPPSAMTVA